MQPHDWEKVRDALSPRTVNRWSEPADMETYVYACFAKFDEPHLASELFRLADAIDAQVFNPAEKNADRHTKLWDTLFDALSFHRMQGRFLSARAPGSLWRESGAILLLSDEKEGIKAVRSHSHLASPKGKIRILPPKDVIYALVTDKEERGMGTSLRVTDRKNGQEKAERVRAFYNCLCDFSDQVATPAAIQSCSAFHLRAKEYGVELPTKPSRLAELKSPSYDRS